MSHHFRTLVCFALDTLLWPTRCFAEAMTLAWDPNTEPEVIGYRLSYGTVSGTHTTTIDVGNQTSATVTGLTPGQRYYFVVRAYASGGVQSAPSNEVTGVAVGLVALTSTNSSSTIPTGAPVTWTALASAGAALEYQFWRLHVASDTWSIVQNYSASNSFTWTPAAGQEGSYVIHVWARVPGSSEELDSSRSTSPFTVGNPPVQIGAIEADAAFPAPTGSPITFKARATGGPAPLEYRFYRFNRQTSSWSLMRDYGPSDSFTWTPASNEQGSYNLQVWVRGAGSTALYDAWRSSDAFSIANPPAGIATVTADKAFPAGTGAPITWKVSANGGPGPLQYRFYRYAVATATWTLVQDYGPSNSYTWTPSSGQAGSYVVQAWVRRSGSTAAYDAWASTPTFQIADAAPVIRSITPDVGPPVAAGAPVTWKVEATGGPGALQYQFWLYSVTRDSWSMVRDFSTSNTFTWSPAPWDAGTYQVQAGVRLGGTGNAAATAATPPFQVVTDTMPTVLSLNRDAGPTLRAGVPIVWTAKVAGGKAPLEYLFARYSYATQQWTTVQAYSWDNTVGWTPMPGEEGTYLMYVWVRRAGSTAAWEHYMFTPSFVVE